uniref:Uncharacterized protein n=1 Tax=Solanum tuberosum TaxID=4113 RepID=M0ZJ73_SOLTU
MNSLFHFIFFLFLLLLLLSTTTTTTTDIRQPPPAPFPRPYVSSMRKQQLNFQPQASAPTIARDFESDMRRVPTGPNPLHNKKRKT